MINELKHRLAILEMLKANGSMKRAHIFTDHGPMSDDDFRCLLLEDLIKRCEGTITYICLTVKGRDLLK